MNRAALQQQFFGQRGLARVRVRNNRKGAALGPGCSRHGRAHNVLCANNPESCAFPVKCLIMSYSDPQIAWLARGANYFPKPWRIMAFATDATSATERSSPKTP